MAGRTAVVDTRLVVGGIYIIIFLRDQVQGLEGQSNTRDFHWGLYYHNSQTAGIKYHIKTLGPGWIADHGQTTGAMRSVFLIGLMRIGYCAPQEGLNVDTIVKSLPLNQVPPGYNILTCRTWTLHIVRLLGSGNNRYVRCSDIAALEQEVTNWGLNNWEQAAGNSQPRPIADSQLCQLA